MNSKNAVLFPLTEEVVPLLRFRKMLKQMSEIEIVSTVSPYGILAEGKDPSLLDEGESVGLVAQNDFLTAICDCDLLILPDVSKWMAGSYFSDILENVMCAIRNKIDIYYLKPLPSPFQEFLEKYAEMYSVNSYVDNISHGNYLQEQRKLLPIQTPVVAVTSFDEECSKLQVQLGVKNALEEQGLKVSYISSKPFGELLGFHSFPSKAFLRQLEIDDQCKFLNHYISSIEQIEDPDIILIGIPGGFTPVDEEYLNGCGLLHSLISFAVNFDFLISLIPCSGLTTEYILHTCNRAKQLMSGYPDMLGLSHIKIDPTVFADQHLVNEKDIYDQTKIQSMITEYQQKGILVYDAASSEFYKKAAEQIITKLT